MPICSRNLSMCCGFLSAWGVIQLSIMGYLFYNHAVAFAEDLELDISENEPHAITMDAFYKLADQKYAFTANNCWVAAGVYVIFFLLSVQQYFANK